jgi:hypothetical protein
VLLACQGQLRLAPSGQVIGIDMNATLSLATVRGYGITVLSELLPAAENGLVDALCADKIGQIEPRSELPIYLQVPRCHYSAQP